MTDTVLTHRERIEAFVDRPIIQNIVMGVIVLNAIILGMSTSKSIMAEYGPILRVIDGICLWIFVFELNLKIYARGWRFFTNGWAVFDVLIVSAALVPNSSGFAVLRALRVLRVLRLISAAPRLRRVVEGLLAAMPGIGSVFLLMGLVFYVSSVMATTLFSETFPHWFGTLGTSAYTLFQIMTLESWSMGIVRPILEVHPFAWVFFVPFIMLATFAVMNLLVGLIVKSMQDVHDHEETIRTEMFRDELFRRLDMIEAHIAIDGEVKEKTSDETRNTA